MASHCGRVLIPLDGLPPHEGTLTVQRALARAPGVLRAYVNEATEMAYIEYDPDATNPSALVRAIADVGLTAGEPVLR